MSIDPIGPEIVGHVNEALVTPLVDAINKTLAEKIWTEHEKRYGRIYHLPRLCHQGAVEHVMQLYRRKGWFVEKDSNRGEGLFLRFKPNGR